MTGALESIRVVDFGQYLPGPLAAMLLADAGADVVRVDPPGGPRWRHHANAILQRGKRSIVLDLKRPSDHATARRLAEAADVVIENFRPGVMQRLQLDAERLTAANPRLIYCSLPGFSCSDPRAQLPAWEGVVAAAAGLHLPGTWDASADPAPVFNPLTLASNFAALRAAEAIVAALIVRQRDGIGQCIEVPLFDAAFELKFTPHKRGNTRPRQPRRVDFDLVLDAQFECADGRFVNLSWLEGRQLRAFAELVGLADELERDGLLDERRLWSPGAPTEELRRRLARVFKTRTAAEWARTANPEADLSDCRTTPEWLHDDEHARASGAVVEVVDPEFGRTVQAGQAFTMSRTPLRVDSTRARLDADCNSILADVRSAPGAAVPPSATEHRPALDGVRVLDLTQILAGPTCGRILAEFGADVIKINAPVGHPIMGHNWLNAGKRSVLLNLKSQAGLDLLDRLVKSSDVFLMNFSPRTAERLHVAEADIRARRSDIVYTAVSCYGWDGPRGDYRGHEQMGQAVTGMQERWGRDLGLPVMQSIPICDLGTGNLAALATMLAVFHRMRTGEGQFVSASLAHTGTFHQIPFMIDYGGRAWDEPAGQQSRGTHPLYRLYRACDRWFFLAAPGHADMGVIRTVVGDVALEDAALEELFATAPAAEWVARLQAAGLGAHLNLSPAEVMESGYPLVEQRELPDTGTVLLAAPSGRLSVTSPRAQPVPDPPGGHNADLLRELGLSAAYADLLSTGVMATEVESTLARP